MRVMILDDEPNIVNGLAYMIGKFGIPLCEVLPFTDPGEALKELEKNETDLVIADINMPLMQGLDFIEKAAEKTSARFVILSGYNDFSYAQKAIHLQVKEYLVKPVDETALLNIIAGVFEEIYHVPPGDYAAFLSPGIERRELSAPMQSILAYIHEHFSGDVSITRLSDATGLHPSYISSLFSREMNTGLHKYIETLRLMKAMKLLGGGSENTMAGIAHSLGYSNERQFYRMFKKLTGKTPGRFRDSPAGDDS